MALYGLFAAVLAAAAGAILGFETAVMFDFDPHGLVSSAATAFAVLGFLGGVIGYASRFFR
jgi:hypothetical protein